MSARVRKSWEPPFSYTQKILCKKTCKSNEINRLWETLIYLFFCLTTRERVHIELSKSLEFIYCVCGCHVLILNELIFPQSEYIILYICNFSIDQRSEAHENVKERRKNRVCVCVSDKQRIKVTKWRFSALYHHSIFQLKNLFPCSAANN